jgi:hypothetical protein
MAGFRFQSSVVASGFVIAGMPLFLHATNYIVAFILYAFCESPLDFS